MHHRKLKTLKWYWCQLLNPFSLFHKSTWACIKYIFHQFVYSLVDLHGLAPSATNSSLREAKLMSLWSFWARSPQCMSRDFTMATEAANQFRRKHESWQKDQHYSNKVHMWRHCLETINHYTCCGFIPLYLVIIFIQEAGSTFIKE